MSAPTSATVLPMVCNSAAFCAGDGGGWYGDPPPIGSGSKSLPILAGPRIWMFHDSSVSNDINPPPVRTDRAKLRFGTARKSLLKDDNHWAVRGNTGKATPSPGVCYIIAFSPSQLRPIAIFIEFSRAPKFALHRRCSIAERDRAIMTLAKLDRPCEVNDCPAVAVW